MAFDTETKTVKQFSLNVTPSSKLNVNKSPEVGRGTDKDGMNIPLHMKKKKIVLRVLFISSCNFLVASIGRMAFLLTCCYLLFG